MEGVVVLSGAQGSRTWQQPHPIMSKSVRQGVKIFGDQVAQFDTCKDETHTYHVHL